LLKSKPNGLKNNLFGRCRLPNQADLPPRAFFGHLG
jgi:hypothetical protein